MIYRLTILRYVGKRQDRDVEHLRGGTRAEADARFTAREASILARPSKERPAVLRLECVAEGGGPVLRLREVDFRAAGVPEPAEPRLPFAA